MRIGIPKEIKNHEYRVAVTPAGVHELVEHGHDVFIETGAGEGSSITDDAYAVSGARILGSAEDVWAAAELLLKVKEPVASEYHLMRPDLVIFTYLHLAADEACTRALLDAGTTSIAYETVRAPDGSLPLLFPMSEVAGRLAPLVGAQCLMRPEGGRGVLIGGVSGVAPARVVIIGAGVSGMNAVAVAAGTWADVVLFDLNVDKLRAADRAYNGRIRTLSANKLAIEQEVIQADLVIGAVLVPGAKAPKVISNELVSRMKPGSVLVDIAIDQGGCFEDSHPTTHADPTFRVHNSIFYCVANMPGAVPHTSTYALTNVTLPYVLQIAGKGARRAVAENAALRAGLSTIDGRLTNAAVGAAHGIEVTDVLEAVAVS